MSFLHQLKKTWDTLALVFKYRHNRGRAVMINRALDFCRSNHVEGEYFEFGVFQGAMCEYTYKASRQRNMRDLHIFAFDSFEGFSEPKGEDNIGLLKKGDRTCSVSQFSTNMQEAGVDETYLTVTPGFFETTLVGEGRAGTLSKIGNKKAAIVYVDCDLYEPARDTLAFIRPFLVDGSVLVFDNWFLFKGSPFRGERKAFTEWCKNNPDIIVSQFHRFGWHGDSFIITIPSSHDAE